MDNEDWELLSWAKRAKNRRRVLKYLLEVNEPRTPSEIASNIDVSMNHVSRALRQMVSEPKRSLVTCINPDSPYDRRYKLTEDGAAISEKIIELEEE